MPARKTYSVLIAWCDADREQGSYGWTGRARDYEDAEDKARRAMWGDSGTAGRYPKKDPPFGSVIEAQEGAIWQARELEGALRDLVKAARRPAALAQAFERARNVLKSIDRAGA